MGPVPFISISSPIPLTTPCPSCELVVRRREHGALNQESGGLCALEASVFIHACEQGRYWHLKHQMSYICVHTFCELHSSTVQDNLL